MLVIFATRLLFAAGGVLVAVGGVPCVLHGAMFAALHTPPVEAALVVAMVVLLSSHDGAVVTTIVRALRIAAPAIAPAGAAVVVAAFGRVSALVRLQPALITLCLRIRIRMHHIDQSTPAGRDMLGNRGFRR